jgi:hypothetical protein
MLNLLRGAGIAALLGANAAAPALVQLKNSISDPNRYSVFRKDESLTAKIGYRVGRRRARCQPSSVQAKEGSSDQRRPWRDDRKENSFHRYSSHSQATPSPSRSSLRL